MSNVAFEIARARAFSSSYNVGDHAFLIINKILSNSENYKKHRDFFHSIGKAGIANLDYAYICKQIYNGDIADIISFRKKHEIEFAKKLTEHHNFEIFLDHIEDETRTIYCPLDESLCISFGINTFSIVDMLCMVLFKFSWIYEEELEQNTLDYTVNQQRWIESKEFVLSTLNGQKFGCFGDNDHQGIIRANIYLESKVDLTDQVISLPVIFFSKSS